ncbi:BrnT family toxin [Haloferula sp.]|uniref:BrnT family toxin n=1 Tax=Haloferula sp. TaxID=2497595 RepID=UPI00329B8AEB
MELDLIDVHFDLKDIRPRELEETLEDPFAVRFLPDNDRPDSESRYFALGRTVADRHLFLCFRTDGKVARVIAAREMTEGEQRFYERKYAEFK